MAGVEPFSGETRPFQIEKSKEGFSITRTGRSFRKKASFGDAISKIWADVSAKPGEAAKQRHFHRMVQLSAGLERALASEPSLSLIESREFENARKTTIITALHMLSDDRGKVNFTKLNEQIAGIALQAHGVDPKRKVKQAQQLSQTAALLFEAVRTGALSTKEDVHQALLSAKVALTQAQLLLSSVDRDAIPGEMSTELFDRMGQLTAEIEKVQHTEPPLTAEEYTMLETARSSLVALALRMVSDEAGHVLFTKVVDDIASITQSGKTKGAQGCKEEVRRLTHIASLLCDGLSLGSSVGISMEGIGALVNAKRAIDAARELLRENPSAQEAEEVCRITTKMRIVEASIRSSKLRTTEEIAQDVSQVVTVVKKDNPSLDRVITQSLDLYAYPWMGKKLQEAIAEKVRQNSDITEEQWKKMVDDEIETFVSLCQFPVDKAKLTSAVLEAFVTANFSAVGQSWQSIPPSRDWYIRVVDAHRVHAALQDNPERLSALETRYKETYKKIRDGLFSGKALDTSIRRQKRVVDSHSETAPQELQQWSESCASVPIRDTFGRIGSIIVQGNTVIRELADTSDTGRLRTAYRFSRQIVEQCKSEICRRSGVERSDKEIQDLVNELMMRCCGDASFMFVFSPLSMMLQDTAIQEVDLSTLRPDFSQFRFYVDEQGNLVAEKVFVVQKKSAETGRTDYAQFTSRIMVSVGGRLDEWTEHVQAESYGAALAKEILEEAKTPGKGVRAVFESRKKKLMDQIKNPDDRQAVIKDMEKYLHEHSREFAESTMKRDVREQ